MALFDYRACLVVNRVWNLCAAWLGARVIKLVTGTHFWHSSGYRCLRVGLHGKKIQMATAKLACFDRGFLLFSVSISYPCICCYMAYMGEIWRSRIFGEWHRYRYDVAFLAGYWQG